MVEIFSLACGSAALGPSCWIFLHGKPGKAREINDQSACAVFGLRPATMRLLFCTNLDSRSRLLIAWFGPRGLSSLLLILIPVFGGVPGSEPLFVTCCLVVLLSVALHGSSLMLLGRGEPPIAPASADSSSNAEGPQLAAVDSESERISMEELRALQSAGAPVLIVDVRADTSFNSSEFQAQGTLQLQPTHSRHAHVENQASSFFDRTVLQKLLGRGECVGTPPDRLDQALYSFAHRLIIVDDRNKETLSPPVTVDKISSFKSLEDEKRRHDEKDRLVHRSFSESSDADEQVHCAKNL